MDPMNIIGAVAVALIVLAYACGLTAILIDDHAKKREAELREMLEHLGSAHNTLAFTVSKLRDVVNANADRSNDVELLVEQLAERLAKPEPVDEPTPTPEIWDRFATPMPIALPPAPTVAEQLVDQPGWAGATRTFDRLAARHPEIAETPSWELSAFTHADAEQVRELAEATA